MNYDPEVEAFLDEEEAKQKTRQSGRPRKCKEMPVDTPKNVMQELHAQKMARKKAERELHAGRPARNYTIRGNLSRRHPKYGTHPKFAYAHS